MWSWLGLLPIWSQILLPIIVIIILIIGLVFIAIYGKLGISWGKKRIGLGGNLDDKINKSRLCIDCSKLHRAEAARVNRKISLLESSIMRDKMNVVEQKLLELRGTIYKIASNKLKSENATDDDLSCLVTRLKLSFHNTIKDEIRRSIKENGFHEKNGREFDDYVDDQKDVIVNLIEDEFMIHYKSECIDDILSKVDGNIRVCVRDIYTNAKHVESEAISGINKLEVNYDAFIDDFIGTVNKE